MIVDLLAEHLVRQVPPSGCDRVARRRLKVGPLRCRARTAGPIRARLGGHGDCRFVVAAPRRDGHGPVLQARRTLRGVFRAVPDRADQRHRPCPVRRQEAWIDIASFTDTPQVPATSPVDRSPAGSTRASSRKRRPRAETRGMWLTAPTSAVPGEHADTGNLLKTTRNGMRAGDQRPSW